MRRRCTPLRLDTLRTSDSREPSCRMDQRLQYLLISQHGWGDQHPMSQKLKAQNRVTYIVLNRQLQYLPERVDGVLSSYRISLKVPDMVVCRKHYLDSVVRICQFNTVGRQLEVLVVLLARMTDGGRRSTKIVLRYLRHNRKVGKRFDNF